MIHVKLILIKDHNTCKYLPCNLLDLIIAGAFNSTVTPQTDNNLNHVAIYDTQSNAWSGMSQVSFSCHKKVI